MHTNIACEIGSFLLDLLPENEILSLGNVYPTPLTILFAVFNAQNLINLEAPFADKLRNSTSSTVSTECKSLLQSQLQWLQTTRINDAANEMVIRWNVTNQRQRKILTAQVEQILTLFQIERNSLSMCSWIEWTEYDVFLSFYVGLMNYDDEKYDHQKARLHPKTWEFMDLFRNYCKEEHYDGMSFLDTLTEKTAGFGLQMMKEICTKYGKKSGPYSKAKKFMNIHGNEKYYQIYPEQLKMKKRQWTNRHRWYWFSDSAIKWIPYNNNHQKMIGHAEENQETHVILDQRLLITFGKNGHVFQCEYTTKEQKKTYIGYRYGMKDEIHGIPCTSSPLF